MTTRQRRLLAAAERQEAAGHLIAGARLRRAAGEDVPIPDRNPNPQVPEKPRPEPDLEALAAEAIELYEGLLARARAQRMVGDKKAWAREAAGALLAERHRAAVDLGVRS